MQTIDSKKNKLSMQEIMVRSLHDQRHDLDVPLDQALLQLVAELQMENSEAIQFGNTIFVTHYSPQSPLCVMYALNVDTAKNYIDNGELYVRYLIKRGIKGFVTSFNKESFGIPFKQIEKNHLGIVDTTRTPGKRFMTTVQFYDKKQEKKNV